MNFIAINYNSDKERIIIKIKRKKLQNTNKSEYILVLIINDRYLLIYLKISCFKIIAHILHVYLIVRIAIYLRYTFDNCPYIDCYSNRTPDMYQSIQFATVITILGGYVYESKIRIRLLFDGLFVL